MNSNRKRDMNVPRVLVIAPHSDDECLGAGGTIALLAKEGAHITVLTVCADLPPLYPASVNQQIFAEARLCHSVLGVSDSIFLDFPAVEVSQVPTAELNRAVQEVVDDLRPTMVFAPFPDRHLDHKTVFDTAMVVTRPLGAAKDLELVALYETISETFWNIAGVEPSFSPNWTVDINNTIETKLNAFGQFESQVHNFPGPRSVEALRSLALFRGSQSHMEYGESFVIARSYFDPMKILLD